MELLEVKALLLAYRENAERYNALVTRLSALRSGGSVTASISHSGVGKGRHSDLSDNVAMQEDIVKSICGLMDTRWDASSLLWKLNKHGLSINAYTYLEDVYIRAERKKNGSDKRYIAMLLDAMESAKLYLPWPNGR